MRSSETSADDEALVRRALDVINEAIHRHREDPVYGQLLQLSQKLMVGREVGILLYDEDPEHPLGRFGMKMQDGAFEMIPSQALRDAGVTPPGDWKVSRDYLERIVKNPSDYVDHPMRLDWDWLRSRLGIDP